MRDGQPCFCGKRWIGSLKMHASRESRPFLSIDAISFNHEESASLTNHCTKTHQFIRHLRSGCFSIAQALSARFYAKSLRRYGFQPKT